MIDFGTFLNEAFLTYYFDAKTLSKKDQQHFTEFLSDMTKDELERFLIIKTPKSKKASTLIKKRIKELTLNSVKFIKE